MFRIAYYKMQVKLFKSELFNFYLILFINIRNFSIIEQFKQSLNSSLNLKLLFQLFELENIYIQTIRS